MSPPGLYEDALARREANNRKSLLCGRLCSRLIGRGGERLQRSGCGKSICRRVRLETAISSRSVPCPLSSLCIGSGVRVNDLALASLHGIGPGLQDERPASRDSKLFAYTPFQSLQGRRRERRKEVTQARIALRRAPEIVEAVEVATHLDLRRSHVEQSGLEPQVFRRFQGSRPGTRRLLGLIPIGVGGIADRLQRKAPTVHIPVVCGDRAAGPGDSHEFSNALLRISQKEQHQSHDRSIHAGVRQGQRLGVALEEANPHRRDALARKRQLFWGWIDTHHCRWPLPPEQGLGEGAIAATIIQPSQPWGQRQPVQERIGHQRAPSPHHQLVRGWIVEDELRGERHVCPGDRHGRLQTGKVGSALIARTSVFPTPIAKWTNSKPFSTSLRLRKPAVCRQRRASGA